MIEVRDVDVDVGDAAAVRAVVCAAFGRDDEADLVAALDAGGSRVVELVAVEAGVVVGHVLFSRLQPPTLAVLAPLSVAPSSQRRGVGARLVTAGLARCRSHVDAVLVLGDPAYYGRFGFRAATAARFRTPYDGPHQQALLFRDVAGTDVCYPAAFD